MREPALADTVRQAIQQSRTLLLGAIPILYPLLEDLELEETVNTLCPTARELDLGRLVLVLVLNRLLAPQPLYEIDRWVEQTVLEQWLDLPAAKLYDQRFGRALDALYPHLGELWARLALRAIARGQLDLSILHWDITSLYFTGAYTDSELIRYGYSRDHRSGTKQVNLQADVTHESRVPIGYRLLAGQTADITTPLGHVDALLRFLARPELAAQALHPILVSDCKMITPEAVAACHHHELFYLGPWAQNQEVLHVLRSVSTEELTAHPLPYRPRRQAKNEAFVPYQGVWRPFTITIPASATSPREVFTDRVLVLWSAGKAQLDQQKRRTYLKRLLNGLANIQQQLNHGPYSARDYTVAQLNHVQRGNPAKRLVQVDLQGGDRQLTLTFRLNRDRLAAAQAVDGRYALGTNAAALSADDALRIFKAQDDAEKQFRTVKGPLAVRPVFLHNDQRIEGLVWVTLVALLVRALLAWQCRQAGVARSADRLLAEFAGWAAIDLTLRDGTHLFQVPPPTAAQAQIMQALGVSPCERYLTPRAERVGP